MDVGKWKESHRDTPVPPPAPGRRRRLLTVLLSVVLVTSPVALFWNHLRGQAEPLLVEVESLRDELAKAVILPGEETFLEGLGNGPEDIRRGREALSGWGAFVQRWLLEGPRAERRESARKAAREAAERGNWWVALRQAQGAKDAYRRDLRAAEKAGMLAEARAGSAAVRVEFAEAEARVTIVPDEMDPGLAGQPVADGNVVYFRSGSYPVAGLLLRQVHLVGPRDQSAVMDGVRGGCLVLPAGTSGTSTVQNFRLIGGGNAAVAILVQGGSVEIINCRSSGFAPGQSRRIRGAASYSVRSGYATLVRCRSDVDRVGLHVAPGATAVAVDCRFTESATAGVIVEGSGARLEAKRCTVEDSRGSGFQVRFGGSARFTDCQATHPAGDGFAIDGALTVASLRGCVAEGASANGYRLDATTADFMDCVAAGSGSSGFVFSNLAMPILSGCVAKDSVAWGYEWREDSRSTGSAADCRASGNGMGGFMVALGSPILVNCTATGNHGFGFDMGPVGSPEIFGSSARENERGGFRGTGPETAPVLTECESIQDVGTAYIWEYGAVAEMNDCREERPDPGTRE